jgi:hypothetical protein
MFEEGVANKVSPVADTRIVGREGLANTVRFRVIMESQALNEAKVSRYTPA